MAFVGLLVLVCFLELFRDARNCEIRNDRFVVFLVVLEVLEILEVLEFLDMLDISLLSSGEYL